MTKDEDYLPETHDLGLEAGGGPRWAWGGPGAQACNETFSVSVYELLEDGSRGSVKVRIRGWVAAPQAVEEEAERIAAALGAGTYTGPKSISLLRGRRKKA